MLQLQQHGFALSVDGLFGPATETAVRIYQKEQGLDDDGIVGPLTWAALDRVAAPPLDGYFATTFAPDAPGLLAELDAATPYRAYVESAAAQYQIPACILAGIGSRESAWGLALKPRGPGGTGDFTPRAFPTTYRAGPMPPDSGGFGRGLLQIDFDAHPFARNGQWSDASANVHYGATVLRQNIDVLAQQAPSPLRAALAGYNCGAGNVLRALRDGRDVDYYTSGRNYAADTLNRAGWYQLHGWG